MNKWRSLKGNLLDGPCNLNIRGIDLKDLCRQYIYIIGICMWGVHQKGIGIKDLCINGIYLTDIGINCIRIICICLIENFIR